MRIAIFAMFLVGCGDPFGECRSNFFENITNLPIHFDQVTPNGIRIDSGGFPIDLVETDRRVLAIADCIIGMAQKAKPEWGCLYPLPEYNPECLAIKLVPAIKSSCSDWDFIGVEAPQELCDAKGLKADPNCPCSWRIGVQNDYIIITPSRDNLYLWDVGRAITSCTGIWNSPYSACLMF